MVTKSVKIDEELAEEIIKIAKQDMRTFSSMAYILLRLGLQKYKEALNNNDFTKSWPI